jgi:hypothetical protein
MEIGVLTEDDLWGQDKIAWDKLRSSTDPELQRHFQRVNADTRFVWDDENPEFRVSTKLRSIDPEVHANGRSIPLSVLDPQFARHRNEYLTQNSGKWPMRVIINGE